MDSADWGPEWSRCLLLLELATRYAASGRTEGCGKLTHRLEEWRVRMEDAPSAVHTFLSELCYVSWLLGRGDLATARYHAAAAGRKAQEIGDLLRRQRCSEARRYASNLRRRSRQLQRRVEDLLVRSELLLMKSSILRERAQTSSLLRAARARG
ncbi:MAG TPA: hypothetical protein VLB76_23790 [Thermoanaerobaculia bacterium]|jgi:hypothetical protein|nr:hypothetical protein [Thermoanaerobaculia bacterium]